MNSPPSVTVAVVAITSARCLAICLEALQNQADAPPFDILVVFDPEIVGISELQKRYPHVRMLSDRRQRAPVELAARAIRECETQLILLTEDHCMPKPTWVRLLVDAQRSDAGAVGGVVTCSSDASATDWAYYFTDYQRYVPPVADGPCSSLTICNVSYRRERLGEVGAIGALRFEETGVNAELSQRFGPLWLVSDAEVTTQRHVRLRDALGERMSFGRQFACDRIRSAPLSRRAIYCLASLALPALMVFRLASKALRSPPLFGRFLRSFPHVVLLVLAWSLGEGLGYLTRREPTSLTVAPDVAK